MKRSRSGRKNADRYSYSGTYSYRDRTFEECNFISTGAGAPTLDEVCASCQKPYGEHKLNKETSTHYYDSSYK